jgi:autotransporter-associated beta strand protein
VILTTTLRPASITESSYLPYSFSGPGSIAGAGTVTMNGSGSLSLLTSNSYTGGTVINNGTVIVTNDNALGASSGLVTMGGGTLEFARSTTGTRPVTLTATATLDVAAGATAQMGGNIAGTGGVTKTDNGTLVLAGTNSLTGDLTVNQGVLTATGSNSIVGSVNVSQGGLNHSGNTYVAGISIIGSGSGYNAIMTNSGGSLTQSNLLVGNASSGYGAVYQTGGAVTATGGGGDCFDVGNIQGASGYYDMIGGTLTVNGMAVGGENNTGSGFVANSTGGNGIMDINGGTVNNLGWLVMCRAQTDAGEAGILNIYGGLMTYAGGGISCNWGTNQTSILNMMGGVVTNTANVGIGMNRSGLASNLGVLNLDGGLIQANAVTTANSWLNFNGGTLRASAASAAFVTGLGRATVYNGGAVFDDNSYAITIGQPLLAPTGYGVSGISLSSGGSGYIMPPTVTITGGSGSNAMATATISGGAVSGIVITCPGSGYNNGDTLTVGFAGGGASAVAPTVNTVSFAQNGTGGLTKNGSGTLTLSGVNTFAGPITNNAGTLVLNSASTYAGSAVVNAGSLQLTTASQIAGNMTVGNGAALNLTQIGTATNLFGNLTLGQSAGTGATLNLVFANGNTTPPLVNCGTLTLNGTNSISIAGAFTVGVVPLIHYSATAGTGIFNANIVAPRGVVATVSNSVSSSTIYAVITSTGAGIVWTGTSPVNPNLWDISISTNWTILGAPTTYLQLVTPGDAVTFNDLGSGLVTLNTNVSPTSVTISNNAQDYTFSGSGQITSAAGLTKVGSGTVTLNLPGTYSVSTVVSNGTLSLGANQTFANLSGNGIVGTASGTPTVTVNSSTNTVFRGSLQGGLGLTKAGNGTLTLPGTNTFSGHFYENSGTVVISNGAVNVNSSTAWCDVGQQGTDSATLNLIGTGVFTNNNDFNLGDIGSATGTLNISNSATLAVGAVYVGSANAAGSTASGVVNQAGGTVQNNYLVIGGRSSTNGVGVYNLSGGSLTDAGSGLIGGVGTGTLNISGTGSASFGTNSYVGYRTGKGTLNMTGGSLSVGGDFRVAGSDASGAQYIATGLVTVANSTLSVSSLTVARGNNNLNAVSGEVDVFSGGTITSTNDVVLGFAGTGHAKLAMNGGTVNVGTVNTKWLIIPFYDTTTGELDITNGSLNLNASSAIRFSIGNTSTAGTPNTINQEGGAVTFYSDFATTIGGSGVLDMAQSGASTVINTYNLDGGTLTVPQVLSATTLPTRIFNFNGGTLKAAGSSANFFDLGTGNAFAYVRTGGAIIDTWTNSITIAQALLNNGVDEDGGLTKNGNGTLTLDGVNTYTNRTTVNAGTLGGTGTIAGALTLNSTATLAPGNAGIGTLTINGNLTLNAGSTNTFEVNGTTPANDVVVAGAGVTYGGVLNIVPSGTFTAGQQFTLFSGAGAVNAGNFSSLAGSPGSGLGFTFTNGVLSVVSTGPGTFTSQPGITNFTMNGANVVIAGTNGQTGDAYYLLTSTNIAQPLSQWQTAATNVLTANGSFTFIGTNVVSGAAQQFYILSNTNSNH